MSIIIYDGKRFAVQTPKEAAGMVQLLANHIDGLRRDVANIARDVVETAKKVSGGSVPPLSIASVLPNLLKGLPAAPVSTPTPTPAAAAKSIHRTAIPTVANGTNTTVTLVAGSTDRLIRFSVAFANYQGGDSAGTISFGAAYGAIPAAMVVQKGGGAVVNLRPLTIVESHFILTADSVVGPTTIDFDIVVVPPSVENFD